MPEPPVGLTQLLQSLTEGRKNMVRIISPWEGREDLPGTDGPHMVHRGGECEGEAADPDIHKMAHFLMDKFGWFESVSVGKAAQSYWIEVVHSYPPEADIETYTKRWAEGALQQIRLPINWQFRVTGEKP